MADDGKPWWDFDKLLNRLLLLTAVGVLGHLFYLFAVNELSNIRQMFSVDPVWLIAAYACMWMIWVSHGQELLIWAGLFRRDLSFSDALKIAMATDLGVSATPTFIGGGPIKLGMLMKKGFSSDEAATVLAMNPVSDVLFHMLFIPVSIIIAGDRYDVSWLYQHFDRDSIIRTLIIIISVITGIVLIRKLILRRLNLSSQDQQLSLRDRVLLFFKKIMINFTFILKKGKMQFVLAFFFNGMKWIMRYLALLGVLMALGLDDHLLVIFFFQWLIYISMMFIPTPGAAVGAEASFVFVFRSVIPMGSPLNSAMFMWRMLTYYIMLLTAAGYLILIRWKNGRII